MKIVVLDGYALNPNDLSWEGLNVLGECKVYDRTSLTDEAEIIARIGDAEIIFTNKTPLAKNIIDACPNIKYIGVLATGYNIVDIAAAKEKNISVTNIPNYSTAAVAQLTFALLLEICHHVGHENKAVHSGRWESSLDFCFWDYPLIELAEKTIGIVGYGHIGRVVAKIAQAFGMKVIAFSPSRTVGTNLDGCDFVSLDDLFKTSDVITLHCPLFPSTQGIICKENIAKMKDGVIILNTGRGQLVVEKDLREALDSGKVYAAGVDVVSSEPIKGDNPLLGAENCFITPHIAWAPKEARIRLMNIAVDNLKAWLNGKPVNVVNP
ncbi:MAG: D-2-hydroxyacid dehydrogenase [Selenomonadaceae bacterium]|nr:D-2-hydroxyacid dehydrogenase [Selenomonadaceae bacterium]